MSIGSSCPITPITQFESSRKYLVGNRKSNVICYISLFFPLTLTTCLTKVKDVSDNYPTDELFKYIESLPKRIEAVILISASPNVMLYVKCMVLYLDISIETEN